MYLLLENKPNMLYNKQSYSKKGSFTMSYNFKTVEKKWQTKWEKEGTFNAKNDYSNKKDEKNKPSSITPYFYMVLLFR